MSPSFWRNLRATDAFAQSSCPFLNQAGAWSKIDDRRGGLRYENALKLASVDAKMQHPAQNRRVVAWHISMGGMVSGRIRVNQQLSDWAPMISVQASLVGRHQIIRYRKRKFLIYHPEGETHGNRLGERSVGHQTP